MPGVRITPLKRLERLKKSYLGLSRPMKATLDHRLRNRPQWECTCKLDNHQKHIEAYVPVRLSEASLLHLNYDGLFQGNRIEKHKNPNEL